MHYPDILNLELDAVTGPNSQLSPFGKDRSVFMCQAKTCLEIYICGERWVLELSYQKVDAAWFSPSNSHSPSFVNSVIFGFLLGAHFSSFSSMQCGIILPFVPGKSTWLRPFQRDFCFPLENNLIYHENVTPVGPVRMKSITFAELLARGIFPYLLDLNLGRYKPGDPEATIQCLKMIPHNEWHGWKR